MTASVPRLSESLRAGRRALEGIRGVRITKDFVYYPGTERWVLEIRVEIPQMSHLIPADTAWCLHVEAHYPFGKIKLYPAKDGGIKTTFPHQSLNVDAASNVPWRLGDICLDSPSLHLRSSLAQQAEPRDADRRLSWHVRRAMDWLAAAAADALLRPDDHYELPAWPSAPSGARTVVFVEGMDTFSRWSVKSPKWGRATLAEFGPHHIAVLRWSDASGHVVAETHWGAAIRDAPKLVPAVWLRLDSPPTLPPWRAPLVWKDLRGAASRQGIDLDRVLRSVAQTSSGVAGRTLLVGFPIPTRMGGHPTETHWQPLLLPEVAKPSSTSNSRRRSRSRPFADGYRDNPLGRWMKVLARDFADDRRIVWLESENWHSDRIGARGRLMEQVRLSRIAILGVGALGSLIAELLVRQGAVDVLLVDSDSFKAGNLVRHRLAMDALNEKKASALAEHLNLMSPHASVRALSEKLPWGLAEARALLDDREIVLDCTAEDAPLLALAENAWDAPKLFVSVSVGREARRLYFFTARGNSFPFSVYEELVEPWLSEEHRHEPAEDDFPWEGAGCWHPLFRARYDDLMLMAATAMKLFEADVVAPPASPTLQVFQKRTSSSGLFDGLERAERTNQAQRHEQSA